MTLEDKHVDGVLISEEKNIWASLFMFNMNRVLPEIQNFSCLTWTEWVLTST